MKILLHFIKRKFLNGIALRYQFSDLYNLVIVLIFKQKKIIILTKTLVKPQCISLDSRADRRDLLSKKLGHNIGKHIFKAYSPKELEVQLLPQYFISKNSLKYLTHSSISGIVSHINCWLELLKETTTDTYLILEDDVVPITPLENMLTESQELPIDFDIIFLGNSLKQTIHIKSQPSNGFFIPWICRRGFYSYIISKNGVKKLLNLILPINITCGGIDTIVGREVRKHTINAYRSEQNFFSVDKNSPSDIVNPDDPNKLINSNDITKLPYELRIKNNTRFLSELYSFT